ncbi:MAG: nucleotidyltransferase domain-containing protein [Acidobacteria bacterium]|nr:nucleotidyltransferase domain-containing protein [Acidobacteriota bacterium]
MAQDKQLELTQEFVNRIRAAGGENLVSVILYGSAAEGEFHPGYSDLNLLCIVRDASLVSLQKVASLVQWWRGKKHQPPLVLTPAELKSFADLFSIELLDMKQRYRVLYGEDLLRDLNISMMSHRFQLEYELREKLVLLRQHLLLAQSQERQLWEVMLHSLTSFTTLFRHVLLEFGLTERKHSREAVKELSSRLNFDPLPFVQLMDVRAGSSDRRRLQADAVAAGYVQVIEKVAAAVDTIDSSRQTK